VTISLSLSHDYSKLIIFYEYDMCLTFVGLLILFKEVQKVLI
jgi:hypothetical protein